jgi:thymidine phosphorylase
MPMQFARDSVDVLQALDAARDRRPPRSGWPLEALSSAPTYQLAALAVFAGDEPTARDLHQWLQRVRPDAVALAAEAGGTATDAPPLWTALNSAVRDGRRLSRSTLDSVASSLLAGTIDWGRLAAWLASCTRHGLSAASVAALTFALRDSGTVVDLRAELAPRRLVRRYPTGSVSEKVALTLTPLITLERASGVATPVIVARSLGFAGGTRDKLMRIPGFEFFEPREMERPLRTIGSCYAVQSAAIAPADRELYAFRAVTGTVDSLPLIAASIACKHLALPVDVLLLDMQFGDAGFVGDREEGMDLAALVASVSHDAGMSVVPHLRDSRVTTGSCIGPALEVWEALAVMGARGPAFASLNPQLLERQRKVTAQIFALLMEQAGAGSARAHERSALAVLRSGAAVEAFRTILREHGVSAHVRSALLTEPVRILGCGSSRRRLVSSLSGRVSKIDYRRLGLSVNVGYNAGHNPFVSGTREVSGIQLHVEEGDTIRRGEALCTIYGVVDAVEDLDDCFEVTE